MGQVQNPFHWRGTVTDPNAFVGREREINGIFTRLRSMGCLSVIGDRRIGKSSLLFQASQLVRGALGSGCRAAYVDLLSARYHTLNGLLSGILDELGEEATLREGASAEKLAAFEARVRGARARGLTPVLFLDEFEALAGHAQEYGDSLLESWRSLGNEGQMTFVTSSAKPLDEVTHQSGLTSSFYNIFAQMRLEPFSAQEARDFVGRAVRRGRFEPGDDVFLLRVGEQHPLRLQVAAWHLYEARQSGEVDFGVLKQRAQADIATMMGK